MAPPLLAHFEGDWSAEERALVEAAVEEAEANGLPEPSGELGASWVAIRRTSGNATYYMASRQRSTGALIEETVDGLADHIRQFAEGKSG